MEDVTAELEKMKQVVPVVPQPIVEMCLFHPDSPLSYYCVTCVEPICSDCAMFGTEHKGHDFEKLSLVYGRHAKLLEKQISYLNFQIVILLLALCEVDCIC